MNEELTELEKSTLGRLMTIEVHFALLAKIVSDIVEGGGLLDQAAALDGLMVSFLERAHQHGSRVNEAINQINQAAEDG